VIDRPDGHRLLLAVADALSEDVLPALSASPPPIDGQFESARYRTRIAANLCRILAREAQWGPAAAAATVADLRALLDRQDESLAELCRLLDDGLRDGSNTLDPAAVHRVLMANVERRLAIARPSYVQTADGQVAEARERS